MTAVQKSLGFLIACALLVLLLIFKLDMRTNINDFFFTPDNPDSAFLIQQLQSDALQRRIILSIGHADAHAEDIFDFMAQFQDSLQNLDGVEKAWSGQLDEKQIQQLLNLYSKHRINLYSLQPEQETPQLFSTDQLQTRVDRITAALHGPDPALIKSLIRDDPMLLTLDWLQRVQASFNRSGNDRDYSALFIDTQAVGMNAVKQASVQREINITFTKLNEQYAGQFSLRQTGVPIFATRIKSQVSQDIQRVSMISTTVILLLFLLVFRSVKALVLTGMVLLATVSVAVLTTQLVFGFVHGLTLALGTTLIGICIDYFIHAMVHGSGNAPSIDRTEAIRKIWPSLILGGATTILGYFALGASGFPGLQQIAVFAASGIVIALLITRFVLPDLMAWFNLELRSRLDSDRLKRMLLHPQTRKVLLLTVVTCFAVGIFQLRWSTDLNTLSPGLEELKENDRIIRARMTSIEPGRFILSEAEDMETALQLTERVQSALEQHQREGLIDHFFPVFPWIGSKHLQVLNSDNWNTSLTPTHIARWTEALNDAGLSASAFPILIKQQQPPLEVTELMTTPAWELLSRQLTQDEQGATVVTWLGKHDVDAIKRMLDSHPGARYFSQKESLDALSERYQQRAVTMLLWGLIAILTLLLWRFKSMIRAIRVLLPALFAILFVLGLNGLLGQSLNILHLIGLLLVAAIGVDYGIFFSENRSGNPSLTFQAITLSALTSSASFACLGLAENPALTALASTVAPGILIGFLLCPVILEPSTLADKV